MGCRVDLSSSRCRQAVGSREYGNGPSISIKCGEFLD